MSLKLLKSTSLVSGMTLLSRILGLTRDIVFSRLYGAGLVMDAFFVAFKIPNFFRRLSAEGAFSQAFVPVFSEYRARRVHDDVRVLAAGVAGTMGAILFLITLVGVVAAPILIMVFAPGWLDEPEKFDLASAMLRVTFPYLFFISLTSFAAGMLNTYGRFAVPAFTPVLLNVVLISFALLIAPRMDNPAMGLAIGVFVAGLVQLLFQLPFLGELRLLVRPVWTTQHEGVRQIGRLMLPAIFGSSVAQINLLIDMLIASFLATGSISWLYYSDRLMEFPLGVFGIALATVILPGLSRHYAADAREEFSATLDWALRLVAVIAIPAAAGLFLLADPMLATLFNYGEFAVRDVSMSGYSLRAYAVGLIGFTLIKILAPGYFSRQDTKTPVKVGLVALATNLVLNIGFVTLMVNTGFIAPHMGLALATSLAAFVNAGLLYRGLRRRQVYRPNKGWSRFFLRLLVANLAMIAVLWWSRGSIETWLLAGWETRVARLVFCVMTGAAVYFAALWLAGLRPRHLRVNSPSASV